MPAGPVVADPLFDDLLADYLESARLRRDISRDIVAGRHLAKAFAGRAIRAIQPVDIRRYLDDRRREGISDSTLKRELNVFCAACNWAKDENGQDIPNPAARRKPSEPPGRVRWLTPEDAARLLAVANANSRAPWLADFIELALMTGMRKGELLGLEWSRVDLRQRLIYFTDQSQQKNRQLGSIPLNERARQALLGRARFRASHCPASPWVFADQAGARLLSVSRSFNSACRDAGIVDFHIHDLRHTCAAWLVQAGVPLLEVSSLLRHYSIEMTQRYAHLSPDQARNAVNRLEGLGDNLATMPEKERETMKISA
ncbi:MAG TPA: site-specific integrase [Verrucomicrobiota bacterium]|nr:site-specific integrase [Verrucomicrobiota bacterium]